MIGYRVCKTVQLFEYNVIILRVFEWGARGRRFESFPSDQQIQGLII